MMLDGLHLLILEDEPIIGFALEDMLVAMGCTSVLIATHLQEALHVLGSQDVDAAILDVNIHGKRSYPVADILAARHLPYIFATGYGDTEYPEEHRLVPTVTKPYSTDDIRFALQSVLSSSPLKQTGSPPDKA